MCFILIVYCRQGVKGRFAILKRLNKSHKCNVGLEKLKRYGIYTHLATFEIFKSVSTVMARERFNYNFCKPQYPYYVEWNLYGSPV